MAMRVGTPHERAMSAQIAAYCSWNPTPSASTRSRPA